MIAHLLRIWGNSADNAGRCTKCGLILTKSSPHTVYHGPHTFCSEWCAETWWMQRRERNSIGKAA